ncbi:multidrug resistance protein EbrB domain protein, partial [Cooperia oncophora]
DLTNITGVSTITYTLCLKYQLEENVRVTKVWKRFLLFMSFSWMLVQLSVGYSMWGFLGTCLFILAFLLFDAAHPLGHLFYALFNNYIAL